jgi:phenylalanyl-tRNA synthetase beta chain
MPSVVLNKSVFEKLVGKTLPIEKLKDRISMLGTDLEKIEGDAIHVEVFPNRPDMLSEQGFARAFSSFIGVKKGLRSFKVNKSTEKVIIEPSVNSVRPFTACAIIKNINFDHEKIREVIQIQEKLHITYGRNRKKAAIGIYPLERIKFPIRYKAANPKSIKFRPLDGAREMNAQQILQNHPTGKEYGHLLDGKKNYPFFIDNKDQILSMPPITNSENTGRITSKTKDVFIECSGFDFKTLSICLNIIATSLAEMGGDIYSLNLEYPSKNYSTPNLEPEKMKLDLNYINKLLGLDLKEKEAVSLLSKMGFGYEKGNVLIPSYRADILHQVDLVEDVAIAYGYENFNPKIPNVATIGKEDPFETFKRTVSNHLANQGFLELNTYNLIDEKILKEKMNSNLDVIKLKNPSTAEYNSLRSWLLPSLMDVLSKNTHFEYPQDLYTIGTCFKKDPSLDTGVLEITRLAVVLCGAESDYTKVRQIIENLIRHLLLEIKMNAVDHPSFIPGRVARAYVKEKAVAYIGEIHPTVLENFGLNNPVAAFELNLTELFKLF